MRIPIPHAARRSASAAALAAAIAAAGCGGESGSSVPYESYETPAQDPAQVLQDQADTYDAISEASRMQHEAAMDAINSMSSP